MNTVLGYPINSVLTRKIIRMLEYDSLPICAIIVSRHAGMFFSVPD
jgi:hypothetical protein